MGGWDSPCHAVLLFSEALVKEGSDTEMVASHHQVMARMATLTNEREKALLEPMTDAGIEFVGRVEGSLEFCDQGSWGCGDQGNLC